MAVEEKARSVYLGVVREPAMGRAFEWNVGAVGTVQVLDAVLVDEATLQAARPNGERAG